MTTTATALTKDQVYEHFHATKQTARSWAAKHGYDYEYTLGVLNNRIKGTRGTAREIKMKLGMITGEVA